MKQFRHIVCQHLAISKYLQTLQMWEKFRTMLIWCLECFRRSLPKLQLNVTTQKQNIISCVVIVWGLVPYSFRNISGAQIIADRINFQEELFNLDQSGKAVPNRTHKVWAQALAIYGSSAFAFSMKTS